MSSTAYGSAQNIVIPSGTVKMFFDAEEESQRIISAIKKIAWEVVESGVLTLGSQTKDPNGGESIYFPYCVVEPAARLAIDKEYFQPIVDAWRGGNLPKYGTKWRLDVLRTDVRKSLATLYLWHESDVEAPVLALWFNVIKHLDLLRDICEHKRLIIQGEQPTPEAIGLVPHIEIGFEDSELTEVCDFASTLGGW
jgi:hypothetical protein